MAENKSIYPMIEIAGHTPEHWFQTENRRNLECERRQVCPTRASVPRQGAWRIEPFAINFHFAVAIESHSELFGNRYGRRNRLWRCAAMLDAEM
jgi:hypothetical protein